MSEIGKIIKDKLTENGQKQMTMNERGKYGEKMMQAIRQIVNLDYNIVAIIHEQKITNDDGTVQQYSIAVQGSARDEIKRYFDVVAYTYIKGGEYCVTVAPHEKLITKDRTNVLPKTNLPFNLNQWFEIVKKEIKIGKSEVKKEIEVPITQSKLEEEYGQDKVNLMKERIEKNGYQAVYDSIQNNQALSKEEKDRFVELLDKVSKL